MNRPTQWAIALTAVVAAGVLAFSVPALAQGRSLTPAAWLDGGMMAMHSAMAPLMSQMSEMHDQVVREVAERLGMATEELLDALADRSLAEIAAEKGVPLEEIEQVITDQMRSFLDQAVSEGTLTPEQVDWILAHHAEYSRACHSGTGWGMMGGRPMSPSGDTYQAGGNSWGCH